MREFRTYGSVRGARSNARPYRDPDLSRLFQRDEHHALRRSGHLPHEDEACDGNPLSLPAVRNAAQGW